MSCCYALFMNILTEEGNNKIFIKSPSKMSLDVGKSLPAAKQVALYNILCVGKVRKLCGKQSRMVKWFRIRLRPGWCRFKTPLSHEISQVTLA